MTVFDCFDDAAPLHAILVRHLVAMPDDGECLHLDCLATPLGTVVAGTTATAICFVAFADAALLESQLVELTRTFGLPLVADETALHGRLREALARYFGGGREAFDLPLDVRAAPFQARVGDALRRIPLGQTLTYEAVARIVGSPKAVRAVGAANSRNRLALLVPCHRVVGSGGRLVGYGGGLWRKRWLLAHERGESPAVPDPTDPERSPPETARAAAPARACEAAE